ncbi:cupredoxin domain-containing protein [Candidatus Woesearchaeota archaeon]|nr:cupredoxin domain-containing protein [Candidatus Woesearchaeota archaeon]
MKKTYLVIILLGIFLIAGCSKTSIENQQTNEQPFVEPPAEANQEEPPAQEPSSQTYSINIKSYAFSPAEIRIKKGDTITWTNNDAVSHTVTSDSGSELNSEALSQGESYSHTFNAQGTYEYYCKPHPFMKAKIIVE